MFFHTVGGFSKPGERLQAALDASCVVGVWEWDHVRHVVVYDRGAAGFLTGDPGLADRELRGETAMSAIHPYDRAWLKERTAQAVRSGGLILAEYRVVSEDGEVRWLLSRGRTDRTQAGEPTHTRGILIDITETREADDRYVLEARGGGDHTALEQAAEHAIALRQLLGTRVSAALRLIVDMMLLQIGREIARDRKSGGSKPH